MMEVNAWLIYVQKRIIEEEVETVNMNVSTWEIVLQKRVKYGQ